MAISFKILTSRFLCIFLFQLCLSSCLKTLPQYSPPPEERVKGIRDIISDTIKRQEERKKEKPANAFQNPQSTLAYIARDPSNPLAGLSVFEKRNVGSITERNENVIRRSQTPIEYEPWGQGLFFTLAGVLTTFTEKWEVDQMLTVDREYGSVSMYKEGLIVKWKEAEPRHLEKVTVSDRYQGPFNLGGNIGEVRLNDSFKGYFDLEKPFLEDEEAENFMRVIYRNLKNSEKDCLQVEQCGRGIDTQTDLIAIQVQNVIFYFTNDVRRLLKRIDFIGLNVTEKPKCFNSLFVDLKDARFSCVGEKNAWQTLRLGDSYGDFTEKFNRSVFHPLKDNQKLYREYGNIHIGWKREEFEKETKSIPDTSPFSYIYFSPENNLPFRFSESLIQIQISEEDKSVELLLEPLGEHWTAESLVKKIENTENAFYLSHHKMSFLRGKPELQKEVLKALFDLFEETSSPSSEKETPSPSSEEETLPPLSENVQFKRKFYTAKREKETFAGGDWVKISDKQASVFFRFLIHHGTGQVNTFVKLLDDFEKYNFQNENPIVLNPKVEKINGFQLGGKIYLRKSIESRKAVMAYFTDEAVPLIFLADYKGKFPSPVIYGNNEHLIYQTVELVATANDLLFEVSPQFQTKEIKGKVYEEYEISGIILRGDSLKSRTIDNLCSLEDLSISSVTKGGSLIKELKEKIPQVHREQSLSSEKSLCPYFSTNQSSSSSDENIYFPKHQLNLVFEDNTLQAIRFYKLSQKEGNL